MLFKRLSVCIVTRLPHKAEMFKMPHLRGNGELKCGHGRICPHPFETSSPINFLSQHLSGPLNVELNSVTLTLIRSSPPYQVNQFVLEPSGDQYQLQMQSGICWLWHALCILTRSEADSLTNFKKILSCHEGICWRAWSRSVLRNIFIFFFFFTLC